MNAVIVGCGKVGSELARTLVNDGHNVSVIDNNQKSIDQISEDLDVMALLGNGADIDILNEAGLKTADIFIAVSASDELNLLTCLMAKQETKCETIARVRNPLYSKETRFIKDRLGLSKIINPEHLAANEIYSLLQFPALSRIDAFEGSDVGISTLHLKPSYKLIGKSLMEIRNDMPGIVALVCTVVRKGEVNIPSGSFVIEEGDDVTIVATRNEMRKFLKSQGIQNTPAENIMITGGGTIAYYLIDKLLKHGRTVRLVERDLKRCTELSEIFPEAEIIQGDGTDRRFLVRHGLRVADAFVPLTGIDEENIVIATYAKNSTDAKVITKVTRTDMNDLIETLNIDSVVFPKLICADIIAQYVRAKSAGAGGNVATLFRYLDNRIEIVELIASADAAFLNKPLMELRLKKDLILAGIIHEGNFTVPTGKDMIREGDSVIVVTTHKGISSLHDLLI
ncbi:MAG: Trk system potassium transporter TrkA [Lachnospiraceae bacterium]|nr:Trk system potassium transporter TrkA [Lachnospiraceae bacterium]